MGQEQHQAKQVQCIKCSKIACQGEAAAQAVKNAPPNCPMKTRPDLMAESLRKSLTPPMKEFARQAALQQSASFGEIAGRRMPIQCRVEETVQFAHKMGYKKLGLAFCSGLRKEAEVFHRILEYQEFDVVSVCCKVGGLSKEVIGVDRSENVSGAGNYEVMCNPIAQAEILNDAKTEFNIVLGLCVGHDSLFLKHSDALCTVVVVKDRVLGHNPVAALHLSGSYCQKVFAAKARRKL
jgi:uncharacterized metal-binding protein